MEILQKHFKDELTAKQEDDMLEAGRERDAERRRDEADRELERKKTR